MSSQDGFVNLNYFKNILQGSLSQKIPELTQIINMIIGQLDRNFVQIHKDNDLNNSHQKDMYMRAMKDLEIA